MADERILITPEMLRWANRKARRYRLRYGEREGRFEGCVGIALDRAGRTWEPGRASFPAHARRVVVQALNEELRRSGPLGYRRDQSKPGNHRGAPGTSSLPGPGRDAGPHSWDGPVGWELEYEDFVVSLARRLPGPQGDVIRAMYLECRGASIVATAREIGLSQSRVSAIHAEAIARIRRDLTT